MWPHTVAKGGKYVIFYADMHDKTVVKSLKWIFPGDFKENN